MLFVPENREDIAKYFRNSFLKLKETGDTLLYITGVEASVVVGKVEDGRDLKLYLASEEPYEVDFMLPHKSFFQYGPDAVMLQRIPARQYHRGLTSENTSLTYKRVDKEGFGHHNLDFDPLKAYVSKQKFRSLSQAVKETTFNSVALSARMMYMPSNRNIYMDFHPIARVSAKNIISMTARVFRDEVADLLQQHNDQHNFTFWEPK